MKQKVVTRAIIEQDGKTLLIRRKGGRPSIAGLYELPGGKVHIDQQPEDSLRGALRTHIGADADTVQLKDVLTFIDPDDRELQYTFVVFSVRLKASSRTITLSDEYDKHVWKSLQTIQQSDITQSTEQILGVANSSAKTHENLELLSRDDDIKATYETLIAYSDGGSRGNPGPSASGFVLMDERSQIIYEGGSFLGHTTNNVAEYTAVFEALEMAKNFGARTVDMRMDSQLVAHQLNGIYKIKNADLTVIYLRIKELSAEFDKVSYSYVAREFNKLADGMVNKILDAQV